MSILGGRIVGNVFFRSKMDKNNVLDHSPTQNRQFLPKNLHFTLYFGYRVAKMDLFKLLQGAIVENPIIGNLSQQVRRFVIFLALIGFRMSI